MSEEEGKQLKIENLIFRLNEMARQRMALHDQLWNLETEGEKMRLELLCLIEGKTMQQCRHDEENSRRS